MQQVFIIHGGNCFNSYEEYLEFLKNFPLDIQSLRPRKSWKRELQEKLGNDFEVLYPEMPNPSNAQYSEWKIWLEKILPLLNENAILVGHSLGGVFIAKYLAENKIEKKIKAAILIAAPFEDTPEPIASFKLPESLEKFQEQVRDIYLIHSKDDPVVPLSHIESYRNNLPSAQVQIFENRQHFNQEEFPELINLINTLSK